MHPLVRHVDALLIKNWPVSRAVNWPGKMRCWLINPA